MPSNTPNPGAKKKVAVLFYSMKARIRKKHSLYESIKQYEQQHGVKIVTQCLDAGILELNGCFPPIETMDHAALKLIRNVRHLSLSTNKISEIADLSPLIRLEVLSLGRNEITRLENLNVARTLRELWISFNDIDSLKGIEALKRLEVLAIAHNRIDDWTEFQRMQHLPHLEELIFSGNPLHVRFPGTRKEWRRTVLQKLPNLRKLDGDHFVVIKRVSSRRSLGEAYSDTMSPQQQQSTQQAGGAAASPNPQQRHNSPRRNSAPRHVLSPSLATPRGTHTYAPAASQRHHSHRGGENGGTSPGTTAAASSSSRNHHSTTNSQHSYPSSIQRPHHPPRSQQNDYLLSEEPSKHMYSGSRDDTEDDLSSDTYV